MNRRKADHETGGQVLESQEAPLPYIIDVESIPNNELAEALLHCYEFGIHRADLPISDRTLMTQRTKRSRRSSSEEYQLFGAVSRNMEKFCLPRRLRDLEGHDRDKIGVWKELGLLVLREAEERTFHGRKRVRVEKWESPIIENIRTIRRVAKRQMIQDSGLKTRHEYVSDDLRDEAKLELNKRVLQFNINPSGDTDADAIAVEVEVMLQELRQAIRTNIEGVLSDNNFMCAAKKKIEIIGRITGGVLNDWNNARGDFFRAHMENPEEARLFKDMIQQVVRCLGYDNLDVEILGPDETMRNKVIGLYTPSGGYSRAMIHIPLVRYDSASHDEYSNGDDLDDTWDTVAHEIAHHDMEMMELEAGDTSHGFLHAQLTKLRRSEIELLKYRFWRDDHGKVQVEVSSNSPNYYIETAISQKDAGETTTSNELITVQDTEGVTIAGKKFLESTRELILALGKTIEKLWKK